MTTETNVLAGLINHGLEAFRDNEHRLSSDLFFGDHKTIYLAIEKLARSDRVIDPITVLEELGAWYEPVVRAVAEEYTSVSSLPAYIRELVISVNRSKADQIAMKLLDTHDIEEAQRDLATLSASGDELQTVDGHQAVAMMFNDLEHRHQNPGDRLSTGITMLDRQLGGLEDGNLIIVAARPGMGKTALMLNIARNTGKPVGIFSLEMTTTELVTRMVSTVASIDLARLIRPELLEEKDWKVIPPALGKIREGLYVNDTGGLSIGSLEAEARRMVARGCRLICIDYLQLIRCKAEKRLEEVSEVSRRLKAMAKNLKVPVLVMAQLNRKVEDTVNPVYNLSMLRESGQIEQDADIIIFVDRPEQRDATDRPGEADLIVAKNRNGETGIVPVSWQGRFQRFANLSKDWYQRTGT